MKTHRRKLIVGHSIAVFAVVASALTLTGKDALVFLSPEASDVLATGATTSLDIKINADTPINALGATLTVPPEYLEIVGISKAKSFLSLWTEETSISEDTGEIHFSGGTVERGGFIGVGTVLTITVRAKKSGSATIRFSNTELFAHDGTGGAVPNEARELTLLIIDRAPLASGEQSIEIGGQAEKSNADFNEDGSISLADMSILAIHLMQPYNPRYDLDKSGTLGLADLSILLSQLRM